MKSEEQRAMRAASPVMTVKQVADYLQCHPSTIYRMLKRGDFASCVFRVGSDWRFIKTAVDVWIAAGGPAAGSLVDAECKHAYRKTL